MLPDVIELLSDMIRIDSRNTMPLEAPGKRPAHEEKMADYVEALLRKMGFTTERQYIAPLRPNLIGFHNCGVAGAHTLGLNAHMDTVGTDGMSIPPFTPTVKDGLIYGRGACDTKGSLAAMLAACDDMLTRRLPVNILFVATSSEETGCQGSALLKLDKWPCDGFIVGEPTSCKPVIHHKCHGTFELVCHGKAAHGSRPELGDNAIIKAARLLCFLQTIEIPKTAKITSPNFINGCTLTPNLISGGTKSNIIPDSCTVTCDMRLLPEAGEPNDNFRRIANDASAALGFKVELGWTHASHAMSTPPGNPFVQTVVRTLQHQGLDADLQAVAYCTDGGNLSAKGFPCVVLGPGDIAVAHSALEYAPVEEIRRAVSIYASVFDS